MRNAFLAVAATLLVSGAVDAQEEPRRNQQPQEPPPAPATAP
jgi:hypothetical protein